MLNFKNESKYLEETMETNVSTATDWEINQLFKLQERQPNLIEQAVHRLLQENEEIRWSVVVGAYRDGQINLGKAAEFLGLPEIELRDRFIDLGIPLRIGSADLAEARAEAEAVRAWFADTTDKERS
ncbi:putative antitoxin, contains HTH domain [Candidatus Methanophagaceae archaeon]|nr:putative antitoxin, contains HTH domain [Methanophagales archaeon]